MLIENIEFSSPDSCHCLSCANGGDLLIASRPHQAVLGSVWAPQGLRMVQAQDHSPNYIIIIIVAVAVIIIITTTSTK
jgi:hypothetical protein